MSIQPNGGVLQSSTLTALSNPALSPVNTTVSTVGAATLSAAALTGGLITRAGSQSGAAFTDTTDTAIAIIAALVANAASVPVGQTWYLEILNTTNAQQTLAGGTGVTLTGVTQIAQNCRGSFFLTYTGVNAVSMLGLSIVDRGIDNFNAATDPTVSSDTSAGFGVGSIIFNTTAGALRWWECRDASAGAAKWVFSGADYVSGGSSPANEVTQFGASTASLSAEGNINSQISSAGINPGATAADNVVAFFSLPASAFDGAASTNRGITITAQGSFAATANTKRIKIIVNPATAVVGSTVGAGGTTVADTGAVTTNGGGWSLQANVFKYGAAGSNTQIGLHQQAQIGAAVAAMLAPSLITATESGAILIAVTGNATTAATDIVFNFLEVNAMN